ncbi:MAG: hypothetical protein DCC53_11765 [Chloroflexi bacterium]|nr:MAG: hypothetical protein DCC53_11765 [Chloroflexota bacterium]
MSTPTPAAVVYGPACVEWFVYHTDRTGDWEIFRLGDIPNKPNANPNLTQHGADDIEPSRSHNGLWIAYSSNRDGNWEIYVASADGDPALTQRVTINTIAHDIDPVWGPNNQLAFESTRDGNWELYVVDLMTGVETRMTDHPANDVNASWSADGSTLAFQSDRTGNYEIYSLDVATGEVTQLTTGSTHAVDPHYSPDGAHIVFHAMTDEHSVGYVMDADGSHLTRITDPAGSANNFAWSPDGTLIAYQSDLDGDLDIYVYGLKAQQTRLLTDNEIADYAPTWYCGSTDVVFTSDIRGNPDIYEASALPLDAGSIDVARQAMRMVGTDYNDIYPLDAPSDEDASHEGIMPAVTCFACANTQFFGRDIALTEPDECLPRDTPWRGDLICD